ncbi:hypothetical protein ACFYW9_40920 [Streptomyces sp. NPDC002698]|uniref:hypothetical protein n=1 Tax=Streptomyces sp. NPDC002698 TaxID=3364660 RepID=UPI0036768AB5
MPLEKPRNFRMELDLSNLLDKLAEVKGMNASQVVRLALRQYAMREIDLSNERNAQAVELSNPAAYLGTEPDPAAVSNSDMVQEWSRVYDRRQA